MLKHSGEKAAGGDLPQLYSTTPRRARGALKGTAIRGLFRACCVFLMVGVLGGMFTVLSHACCAPLWPTVGMGWFYFTIMGLLSAIFVACVRQRVQYLFQPLSWPRITTCCSSLPIPLRAIIASRLVNGVPHGPDVLRRGDRSRPWSCTGFRSPTAPQPSCGGLSDRG